MSLLLQLRPTVKQTVANIVTALDLPPPSTKYDWCFGKATGTCVMFQWFDQIEEIDGKIQFIESSEQWATRNANVAESVQLKRAWNVHNLVLSAYVTKRPIHVAIVDGLSKLSPVGPAANGRFKETGQAKFRVLDNELWWPHHRNPATGQIVVIRGTPQPENYDPLSEHTGGVDAEEAPSTNEAPRSPKRESKTTVYDRDSGVVRDAKARAHTGRCEYCDELGFETGDDRYYLEAHHVIPISMDGPDAVWNVAMLCANDHRRAHFGKNLREVRNHLIGVLGEYYPEKKAGLIALAETSE